MRPRAFRSLPTLFVLAFSIAPPLGCGSNQPVFDDSRKIVALPAGDNARIAMHYADFPNMKKIRTDIGADGSFAFTDVNAAGSAIVLEVVSTDTFDEKAIVEGEPNVETNAEDELPVNAITLVEQHDLDNGPVHITVLSDYLSRLVYEHAATSTAVRVRALLDTLAAELLFDDINLDGDINYADVLAFDPQDQRHLNALVFDYNATLDEFAEGCDCSIRDAYASGDQEALDTAFGDNIDWWLDTELPEVSAKGVDTAQIAAGFGGEVTIDELPNVVLNAQNSTYNFHSAFDGFDKLTLRATPEDHYTLRRWVGCSAVQADGSCVLLPSDKDVAVEAQFAPPETLQDNVPSIVKMLSFAADTYRTVLVGDRLRIIVVQDSPLDVALQAGAVVDGALATNLGTRPLAKITAIAAPRTNLDSTNAEYQVDTVEVTPDKVYQSIASFEPTTAATVDDVAKVTMRVKPSSTLARLAGVSGEIPDPRDGKVQIEPKQIWIMGYGKGFEIAPQLFLISDPETKKLRFATAAAPPQVLSPAESARAAVSSCQRNPNSVDCQVIGILPSHVGQRLSYLDAPCTLWSSDKFCPIQATLTRDFGALRVVLTLEAFLGVQASGSINFGPGAFVNGESRGLIEAGLAMKVFIGIGGSAEGSFGCSGSAGKKSLPSFSNAKMEAEKPGGAKAAATGTETAGDQMTVATETKKCEKFVKTDRADENKQEKEVADVSTEITRPTPDGALMPLKVGFKMGVEASGNVGIEVSLFVETVTYWDADFAFGKRCRRWGLFDCDPWKFEVNGSAKFRANTKLALDLVANGSVAPYAAIYIGTGFRGIKEDLLRLEAKATASLDLVGGYAGLRYTSLRSDRAQGLAGWCMEGKGSLMLSSEAKAGIYAVLDATFERELPFGIKLNIGQKFTLAKVETKRQLMDPKALVDTQDEVGPGGIPICKPLAENVESNPEEVIWKAGDLKWNDSPEFGATKTHQLTMQEDGNLVLYKFNLEAGKVTGKRALWASNTAGRFGARAEFQKDGNFVIYDIRERPMWSSGTNNKGATTLKLQSDGNLVVYRDGDALWATNTSGQ